MKSVFSLCMIVNAIVAFTLGIRIVFSYERRYADNKILALFTFFSGIWSFGFGMLIIQKDVERAYLCRSIGIIGTIGFMITAQMLVVSIAKLSKQKWKLLISIAMLGIPIYFMAINRSQTIYVMSNYGMTYQFKPGIINAIYSIYFLIVSFNIWLVLMYMIYRSPIRRIKYFGKRFIILEVLVLGGTVLDMIFPLIGLPAVPGSNITQFWALLVLWVAMIKINASRVNIKNMSQYVYFSLGNAVLVFDNEKHLQIANDASADFLGLDRLLPTANYGYRENVDELFDVSENDIFIFEGDHKSLDTICLSNKVKCNLEISKIKDEYGDLIGYIIMVNDLTERIRYMTSLEEAKKEADYANQAKSIFLANMSHEIRTPMNAIMGFAELAMQKSKDDELRDYLIDIKQSSEGLLGIINDILNISKIESGRIELVNTEYSVAKLLRPIYHMIKQLAEKKNLEFYFRITKKMPKVLYGDELRIREILINLLNNSIKYTESGEVILTIDVLETKDDMMKFQFGVHDTGIGIKQEDIPYLFTSFQRVDEEKNRHIEGTGLGLSIVKGYVDLMDGTIEVESEYGKGSDFKVIIWQKVINKDIVEQDDVFGIKELDSSSLGKLYFNNQEILVVDDNEVNLKVMEKTLEAYGLKVDTANSGVNAIRLCSIKNYSIVFMDQMMPEMSGNEAMRAIRESLPYYKNKGKIVMLTANAFEKVKEEAVADGFDDYLKKPLEYNELERVLSTYLEASTKEDSENINEEPEKEDIVNEATENEDNKKVTEMSLLNISEGIAHCAGSKEIYKSALKIAVKNEEKDIEKLLAAYNEKDFSQIGIQAHAMKGSCLNLGASYTGELARLMEFAGKEENAEYVEQNIQGFIDEYRKLIDEIRRYLEETEG